MAVDRKLRWDLLSGSSLGSSRSLFKGEHIWNLRASKSSLAETLFEEARTGLVAGGWHWFKWHFGQKKRHPFAWSLASACADCEERLPGLGRTLLQDVLSISGREKHEPDYEQLLQKLAEILVLQRLLTLDWPNGTRFEHEPAANNGKRPELLVETPDKLFLFEVKAPSLFSHKRARASNPIQLPGRMFDPRQRETIAGGDATTLPRDNPIKDFLVSADEKFCSFNSAKQKIGVLVIVWDDFIYEPITSLVHEPSKGLLTENSFHRTQDNNAVKFPDIDGVILVRHLDYLLQATRDELYERANAFDFGATNDLPNVYVPVPDGTLLPMFILDGLRAVHFEDDRIRNAAEYRPQEFIWWFDLPSRNS